jgi:hypothetical protein
MVSFNINQPLNQNKMAREEIKKWIDRWSKLKPSPKRDVAIKIWSRLLKLKSK